MTPLCSPFSFLLGLIPKSSFSTHTSLAAFSMTAFSVNQLYTVVEPVGVFILCLCLLKSIPQQHHPYHQPCFGLIQILLQCLPSHFNHVLKNSPLWKQQRSQVLVVYEYPAWLLNLAWKECAQVLVGSDVHAIWPAQSIMGNLSIQAGDSNL